MSKDKDSRVTEKLVALLHFEMGGGSPPCEIVRAFGEDAMDWVLNPGGDEDLTSEQMEHIDKACFAIAEQMVVALVRTGYAAKIEEFIEDQARRRRECDAKFGIPRSIPLSREEHESLAKQWGRHDEDEVAA